MTRLLAGGRRRQQSVALGHVHKEAIIRGSPVRALLATAIGTCLLVTAAPPLAQAVPPENDEISQAQVISGVPSRYLVDTSEATTNFDTDPAGRPCIGGHTVWYRIRPGSATNARVITYGSAFDTMLGVFRGSRASLQRVACNDDAPYSVSSAVRVRFEEDTRYFIALSTCCSRREDTGGPAVLRLYRPRAFESTVSVDGGQAGAVSGRALVSGTARCSNPGSVALEVQISQRVGDSVARGWGYGEAPCERKLMSWSVKVDSESGTAFRPGPAAITLDRYVSDGFSSDNATEELVLTLTDAPNARAAAR